jgi:ribosomal protein L37AE/L43A
VTKEDLKALAAVHSDTSLFATVNVLAREVLRLLAQEEAREAEQTDDSQWHKDWIDAVRELKKVQTDCDRLEAELLATNVMLDNLLSAVRKHKAQEEARGEVVDACPRCSAHEPEWLPDAGCWRCENCSMHLDTVERMSSSGMGRGGEEEARSDGR